MAEAEVVKEEVVTVKSNTKQWRATIPLKDKKQARDRLMAEIIKYKPIDGLFPSDVEFPHVNILLLGGISAGKSSFYNTIISTFMKKPFAPARSGCTSHSLTSKLTKYPVMTNDKQELNFKIWDMRGLEDKHFMTSENMKYILEGNIPDKFGLDPSGEVHYDSPGFESKPRIFHTIHCVAVVIDSSVVDALDTSCDIVNNIKELRCVMNQRDIPMVGVLTKVDKLCEDTSNDVLHVYHSTKVAQCVDKVADVYGLPRHSIFPVKNYEKETEIDADVDVVVLIALKGILEQCDAFLVNRYKHIVDQNSMANAIKEENEKLRKAVMDLREEAIQLESQLVEKDTYLSYVKSQNPVLLTDFGKKCKEMQQRIQQMEKEKNELLDEIKSLNSKMTDLNKSTNPKETVRKSIKVQLYQKEYDVPVDVINSLTSNLSSDLNGLSCDVEFIDIKNTDEIIQNCPLLAICACTSRLGTDVEKSIAGLTLNVNTALLIFHHKEKAALPDMSSDGVLVDEKFAQLGAIIDLGYCTGQELYSCNMNLNGIKAIVNFIYKDT